MLWPVRLVLVVAPLVALAGCVAFHDLPLDPAATESGFRARRLDDPELLAFVRGTAGRDGIDSPRAWDLDQLTRVALFESPALDVVRARVGVVAAAERTAGARPNPSARLDTEHSANPPAGDSPWLIGLVLDLPLQTAGKRELRLDLAAHLTEAERLAAGAAMWAARAGVRTALLAHLLDQRGLDLRRAEAGLLAERVALLRAQRQAGAISRPEVDRAELERLAAEQQLPLAEGRVEQSLVALAAAVGLPTGALREARLVWPGLQAPPPAEILAAGSLHAAGLLNRLDVRSALARYEAAQSALALEVARQYPDLTLGPGYLFDQGQDKLSFGLGAELPLLSINQGPIAEAEARRGQARAEVQALQADVLAQTDAALARYDAAHAALDQAEAALAISERREAAARHAVALGAADALALSGARLVSAAAGRARLDALRAAQEALGALEDAVQRPLLQPDGQVARSAPPGPGQ